MKPCAYGAKNSFCLPICENGGPVEVRGVMANE